MVRAGAASTWWRPVAIGLGLFILATTLFFGGTIISVIRNIHIPDSHNPWGSNAPASNGGGGSFKESFAKFSAIPEAAAIKATLKSLTDDPHIAGTSEDHDQVLSIKEAWEDAGISHVELAEFEILLNYPVRTHISMSQPVEYATSPWESPSPEDPTSNDPQVTPGFHGYSANGTATGPLVYINYCRESDFVEYETATGGSVAGAVVICRYGYIFRGNKVNSAERRGAVGVIIYSDPLDDGYLNGDVMPDGPWLPSTGLQRGSVGLIDGDPLTPGWASIDGARRLEFDEAHDDGAALPLIPSVPVGWEIANNLMSELQGTGVDAINSAWQGGLQFPYKVGTNGGGAADVIVTVENIQDYASRPIWNVVGIIEGAVEPDRAVILGNHHDAWVFGAADPSSGSATLNEVAKAFGEMVNDGWKPRRTIVLCSWDAEEYGLVGSVEWVEQWAEELGVNAVAYINVDIAVEGVGPIRVSATPQLADVARDVAKLIDQPDVDDTSIYDYWLSTDRDYYGSGLEKTVVEGLGSGSDFSGFLYFAGVSAFSFEFGPVESYYATYHSIYDSFYWMENFGDPNFSHHKAMAVYWGGVALRLAEDHILPFNYVEYGDELVKYVAEVSAAADEAAFPGSSPVDFTHLEAAAAKFATVAGTVATEIEELKAEGNNANPLAVRNLNDRLMYTERAFLLREGISPSRSWFKHAIFSPGEFDSYASESFPAISDALHVGDWEAVEIATDAARRAILAATNVLKKGFL